MNEFESEAWSDTVQEAKQPLWLLLVLLVTCWKG